MVDISDEAVQRGVKTLASSLDRLVKKEKLTAQQQEESLARVQGSTDYAALKDAQIVIEAATENPDLKLRILRQVEDIVGAEAVIASNTSSISITQLAAVLNKPDRCIGMHFFNLVPLMGLLQGRVPRNCQSRVRTSPRICVQAATAASHVTSMVDTSTTAEGVCRSCPATSRLPRLYP